MNLKKLLHLFHKKHFTFIDVSLVTAMAACLVGLFLVSGDFDAVNKFGQVLGLSQSAITQDSDAEFGSGTLATTVVQGSGSSAVIELEGQPGPDNTIYKRNITIDNSLNTNTLYEYQVFIDGFDTTGLVTASKLQDDCDDIRFTNSSDTQLSYFIVPQTCNTTDTEIYVQVDQIDASTTTDIYMYYGAPSAVSVASIEDTFTYSQERVVGIVGDTRLANDTLKILSLEDGNSISDGTSTLSLDEQGGGSFPASELSVGTEISAQKLIYADGDGDGIDMLTPISHAGTEFIHYADRYDQYYVLYSHWGDATVSLTRNGTSVFNGTITQGNYEVVGIGTHDDARVYVSSNIPIYAYHYAINGGNYYDSLALYPATSDDVYGIGSNYYEVAAGPSGATFSFVNSSGTTGGQTLSANQGSTTSSLGAQGRAPAYRFSTDLPFGVTQLADADGGENSYFWPKYEMGTKFGANNVIQYIAVAAPEANTTCTVYNNSGGIPSNPESGFNNPHTGGSRNDVNYLYFGQSSNSNYRWQYERWMMTCDKPVFAYYEAENNNSSEPSDEHNLWSYPQMRQFTYPTPSYVINSEATALSTSGTFETATDSNVIDLDWNGDWGDGTNGSTGFAATVANVSVDATITFDIRVSTTLGMLTSAPWLTMGTVNGGTSFTQTKSELDTLGVGVGLNRYAQIRASFASSDGITNPQLDTFSLTYMADQDVPTNPTALTALDESGGSNPLSSGEWYNYDAPFFSWTGATDDDSGVSGYYVYFGDDTNADPEAEGTYVTAAEYTGSSLINNTTYYLRIKAVDAAGNVAVSSWAPFNYVYDGADPFNPSPPTVLPAGYSSTNSFNFAWADNGDDAESGLYGYCYKTGTTDTMDPYYSDTCITGNSVNGVTAYQEGPNLFYVRSIDNSGNASPSYVQITYYYNTTAPSEPRNIVVTAATSLVGTTCSSLDNCYEVTWYEPATYSGLIENYYYSVNVEPTAENATQTTTAETSTRTMAGRPLANQQGLNTLYMAAQDDSGNIQYTLYGTGTFTANTTAPGIPENVQATDSSNRDSSKYQVTLTWDEPTNIGSGVSNYNVYRSEDDVSYTLISTTPGSSFGYLDTGLTNNQTYYYKISAEDNASNESAESTVVSVVPTGRFTEPPEILIQPSVSTSILSATVTWKMARECTGYVQYKKTAGASYAEQGAGTSSEDHSITAVGLDPNTSYFYRIRCADIDGNEAYSTEDTFITNDAPSAPQDLVVTPSSNTLNSFAFTWDAPADAGVSIDYYLFSVNQEPNEDNVVEASTSSLTAGPYATRQGTNTFYVIAVDTAGNVNYDNFASVDFQASTAAPGIPRSVGVTDSSDRSNELYRLTIAWNVPTVGGVSYYNVYRSSDGVTYEKVVQTSSLGFFDSGLDTETKYFYKVTALDDAGAESAVSTIVNKQPTGRYPTPPAYTLEPTVEVTSSTANITWTTDRPSSTFVVYSLDDSYTLSTGKLDETLVHNITVTGLNPGSTYNYKLQSFDDARDYSLEEALSIPYSFTTAVAPAISNVSVDDVRQTSAIISWETTTVSSTVVKYGKTTGYENQIGDQSSGGTTLHTVRLSDLDPESLYHVKISGTDVEGSVLESDDYVFQTLAFPRIFNVTFEPVEEASSATIKVSWETNVETDSIVEYRENEGAFTEQVTSELSREHELVLADLKDNTSYEFRAKGRDQYGNVAVSEIQNYDTPFDTRPPKISNVVIETAILGVGQESEAQIIISWKTDEVATSQIEYAEGVGGDSYTNVTIEDNTLTNSHIVIVSDVTPSKPYHLRVVSRDNAANTTKSSDHAVITGRVTESVLDLIVLNLQDTFGWLSNIVNIF